MKEFAKPIAIAILLVIFTAALIIPVKAVDEPVVWPGTYVVSEYGLSCLCPFPVPWLPCTCTIMIRPPQG